jgi:hypothetical protein
MIDQLLSRLAVYDINIECYNCSDKVIKFERQSSLPESI